MAEQTLEIRAVSGLTNVTMFVKNIDTVEDIATGLVTGAVVAGSTVYRHTFEDLVAATRLVGLRNANGVIADTLIAIGAATGTYRAASNADINAVAADILLDTGTTIPGLIAGIEGGGVGSAVNVLPATGIVADRSAGVTLTPVVGETISQAITVYQSDGTTAVDLSGKTIAIIFETMGGTDVAVVAHADITVSGTDDNVVTFAYPSAVTASERVLRFALRDAAAPLTMYLQGVCSVVSAPKVDA